MAAATHECPKCKQIRPRHYFNGVRSVVLHCCLCRKTDPIEHPTYAGGYVARQVRFDSNNDISNENSSNGAEQPRRSSRSQGQGSSSQENDEDEEEDDGFGSAEGGAPTRADYRRLEDQQDKMQVALQGLSQMMGNFMQKMTQQDASGEGLEDEESDDEGYQVGQKRKGQSKNEEWRGLFPWVKNEILQLVIRDALEPEQLIKLRNPDCKMTGEEVVEERPTKIAGVPVEYEQTVASQTAAFVKAFPTLYTFLHVFATYAAIRAFYSEDSALGPALLQFMTRIIELNVKYVWTEGVAPYIAMVCRHRFGTASAKIWARDDQAAYNTHLDGNTREAREQQQAQPSGSSSKSKSKNFSTSNQPYSGAKPDGGQGEACMQFNTGQNCKNCKRPHVCSIC